MEITQIDTSTDERQERLRMVRESAEEVLRDDLGRSRRLRFGTAGYDPQKLKEFAALGWVMILLPEEHGGLGLGMSEMTAIACELGRRLTPEPVWQMAVAGSILPVEALLAGTSVILPAFASPGETLPELVDGAVSGSVEALPLGGVATAYVVQTDSGAVLVDASAPGVTVVPRPSHDGGHLASLSFDKAAARPVTGDAALMRERATLAHAAYCLGLAEAAFEITSGYLKDRRQFDRPIGSFQALQHQMVDLLLELSLARASVEQAAETCDTTPDSHRELQRQISLARVQAARAADLVTRAAIQLHGGIGYTDEADIGLFLRKNMVLSGLMGSVGYHQARALELMENRA